MEGVWYNHVVFRLNKKHWAIKLVQHRRAICYNCPYFDKAGTSSKVILKGLPSCSRCGCNIDEKTACISCYCALKDEGKIPHWDAIKIKNDYLIENQLEKWLNS